MHLFLFTNSAQRELVSICTHRVYATEINFPCISTLTWDIICRKKVTLVCLCVRLDWTLNIVFVVRWWLESGCLPPWPTYTNLASPAPGYKEASNLRCRKSQIFRCQAYHQKLKSKILNFIFSLTGFLYEMFQFKKLQNVLSNFEQNSSHTPSSINSIKLFNLYLN